MPITHRNGWSCSHPIITKGQVVQVNSLDIDPLQGDFDFQLDSQSKISLTR